MLKLDQLGAEIPITEPDETSHLIYMVNPFNDEAMLPHLCAAFLRLFSAYASGIRKSQKMSARDLVLQVIPLSFLADCECLTIPPPKSYIRLAFEVYSRCSPANGNSDGAVPSLFSSGSAIRLARPIPNTINFRLTPQPPHGLLTCDSSLHLAYSWDTAQQWLACAWSDNLGIKQWSAVYCLQEPEPDFWAAFSETVKEILDTTRDMLQPVDHTWSLHILKDRDLEERELDGMLTLSDSTTLAANRVA